MRRALRARRLPPDRTPQLILLKLCGKLTRQLDLRSRTDRRRSALVFFSVCTDPLCLTLQRCASKAGTMKTQVHSFFIGILSMAGKVTLVRTEL